MKNIFTALFLMSVSFAVSAKSEIRYMDDIAKELLADEKDLGKVLQQFKTEPHKDPKTGVVLQKILWIEKGSAWEKVGIKVGDFLANGKAPKPK